jgi:ABC-type transporter Mla maintaining outer membrane lipid asymmetry ATPase subunit MlaF
MNDKIKELEVILTEFDNKLTDFLISHQLEEVKKQKNQAEILVDITRLVSAMSYENLITFDEDMLKDFLKGWQRDMVDRLIMLRDTIK